MDGNLRRHRGRIVSYEDDDLVLNFHDACIYGRDLRLLEDPKAWLNDSCIHYYITSLHRATKPADDCISRNKRSKFCDVFLDPTAAFCLVHQCTDDDEVLDWLEGYDHFQSIHRVFIPISDTFASSFEDRQIPGLGTHWTLLLLQRHEMEEIPIPFPDGFHFDSASHDNSTDSANLRAAQSFLSQWDRMWQCWYNQQHNVPQVSPAEQPQHQHNHDHSALPLCRTPAVAATSTAITATTTQCLTTQRERIQSCRTPQQMNGYDCALHTLLAIRVLHLHDYWERTERLPSSTTATTTASVITRSSLSSSFLTKMDYENLLEKEIGSMIRKDSLQFGTKLRIEILNDILDKAQHSSL